MSTEFKGEVCWAKLHNVTSNEDYICIQRVYVPPEHRGLGYARRALDQALLIIRQNYPELKLVICAKPQEDCVHLLELVDFYRSFGFVPTMWEDKVEIPFVLMQFMMPVYSGMISNDVICLSKYELRE